MLRTHTADIHGFQSAHSAVILNLYARKIAQGIGNTVRAQPLQLLSVKLLHGNHLARTGLHHYGNFVQMAQSIRCALCENRHTFSSQKNPCSPDNDNRLFQHT